MEPEVDLFSEFLAKKYVPNVSYVSAFLILLVILFMIGMSIYDYKLVDRLYSGSLWRTPYATGPSSLCTFFGWNLLAITTFDSFMNIGIAVKLQLVFIHNIQITEKIETAYWIVPIIISLLISFPPLVLGKLGWSKYNRFYIAEAAGDLSYQRIFEGVFFGFITFSIFKCYLSGKIVIQLWRLIALVYLTVVVVIVFMGLNRGATLIDSLKLNMDSENSSLASRAIRLLGYRVLLYPISMLITHSGRIISQFYFDLNGGDNVGLDRWTMITYPLIGTLNFVAFCCDPKVHNAVRLVYYRIKGGSNGNIKNADQLDSELAGIGSRLEGGKGADGFDNDYVSNQAFSALIKSL